MQWGNGGAGRGDAYVHLCVYAYLSSTYMFICSEKFDTNIHYV